MRERQQIKLKQPRVQSHFTANIGDVVLVKDDLPRGSWRLGRIQELTKSRDGHYRSARVLLSSNRIIGRPLSLLYPIECQDIGRKKQSQDIADARRDTSEVQTEGKDSDSSDVTRPKRYVANIARARFTEQLINN